MMHTPEKLHLGIDGHIYAYETGGELIAEVTHGKGDKSVKGKHGLMLVRRWNTYDALVAALEQIANHATADDPCWKHDYSGDCRQHLQSIARAALAVAKPAPKETP
jgi:hypothetical protein